MTDISACGAITTDKVKCKLRYECKRHTVHLASVSKMQSYIQAQYQADGTCDMMKAI
jgi:hypothetical protein